MDSRSTFGGFILIGAGCGGSALISTALSLPASGFVGLLLVILPIFVFVWFLEIKIKNLEEITRSGTRQVRREVEEQGGRIAHQYGDTVRQMTDLNTELRRRIYR